MAYPILYSFRRCPYAMRARLAIASAGLTVELREVVLRDKAPEFLETSPKGTVPVLVADQIIEESYDVMLWALTKSDPEGLTEGMDQQTSDLIAENDGPFKTALDRTKYAVRYPDIDPAESHDAAMGFIRKLETQLDGKPWLYGSKPKLADLAILPFVRQFAHIDQDRWQSQPVPSVQNWLESFKSSDRFATIMVKPSKWLAGDSPIFFPAKT